MKTVEIVTLRFFIKNNKYNKSFEKNQNYIEKKIYSI